ncbi:MAG TPA: molecular chaperone [Marinagarivorans sp.]
MIAGFDYGTSNCALGVYHNGEAQRIRLEQQSPYLPSLVYAECREAIVEYVASRIPQSTAKHDFLAQRAPQLRAAASFRQQQGIAPSEALVSFGSAAMAEYQLAPDEGFFAKSPKSFLGASGLNPSHLAFFEDIVTAMMMEVNKKTAQQTEQAISHVVIGRPVNFASLNTREGNRQAIEILTRAAQRCGYQHIEFLYEPLAAGLAFEQSLTKDQLVLVLDIGGGTSDCSMMHMGPSFKHKAERGDDFLAHCGIRTGGNDLDIALAAKAFMPLMGMQSHTKDGLPLPATLFWNAVRINDVNAQAQFYSPENLRNARSMAAQVTEPHLFQRYLHMLEHKKNFSVIKTSEQSKIALSSDITCVADLGNIEDGLELTLPRALLSDAIAQPLQQIEQLVSQAIAQANAKPDIVFITGGSGQSPIIRDAMQHLLGDIKMVDGDHFGSVVSGLTQWAGTIFR